MIIGAMAAAAPADAVFKNCRRWSFVVVFDMEYVLLL
jgi:hypothetical protein